MQQQVMDLLLQQEEVSWKTILYDLVKTKQMDPWDINITLLTQEYIKIIKKMQEHDLRVSGKILLAAAFLLKMKSAHLIDNDLSNLDKLMNQTEDAEEELLGLIETNPARSKDKLPLIPRNPQPRNRKVSIHDLVQALQHALASKRRILARDRPVSFHMPKSKTAIITIIRDMYYKIVYYAKKEEKLTFSKLLPPSAGKKEKVYTFVPLLHLENEQKISTEQAAAFGEIFVKLTPADS